MEFSTPRWVRDAVFYQIFPDRFASSPAVAKPSNLEPWDAPPTLFGFKGGDLEGIRERLGDLVELGITAIYLTPVFASTANHRYHTYDYFQVDPLLGGNLALRRLLDDAHLRGLRVVLDGVFNHASRGFYQFNHTLENGAASPYLDWFHFNRDWLATGKPLDAYATLPIVNQPPATERSLNLYGYRAWWDIPALPKFNTKNLEVRAFLLSVAEYWVDFGIDGWRLDVPSEIDDDSFWQEFRRRVKARNPDAYLCGEIWDDAQRWLQGDQFDGVMNYPLGKACMGFAFQGGLNQPQLEKCGLKGTKVLSAEEFGDVLKKNLSLYSQSATQAQLNSVTSHDTPRLMNLGLGDTIGTQLLYLALFTLPGAPCIYYGDEIAMAGDHDPDNRRGFEWDKNLWDTDLRCHLQLCAQIRRDAVALRQGDFSLVSAHDGLVAYCRRHVDGDALVVLNASSRDQQLELRLADHGLRTDRLEQIFPVGERAAIDASGVLRVSVKARRGVVLVTKG